MLFDAKLHPGKLSPECELPGLPRLSKPPVADGEWFELRIRSQNNVVTTFVNGRQQVQHDFTPVLNEGRSFLDGGNFAIQSFQIAGTGQIQLRSVQVRNLDGSNAPQSQPTPAAMPAQPVAPSQVSDPRFEPLVKAYELELAAESEESKAKMEKLNTQLLAALDREEKKAMAGAGLDAVIAIRTEKKRLQESGGLPATDEPSLPKQLQRLRAAWRSEKAKIDAQAALKAAPVREDFVSRLEQLERLLTQEAKIEDALAVRGYRLKLANAVPAAGRSTHAAPGDAVEFQGGRYKLFQEVLTWKQAKLRCEQLDGRLAVVANLEMNQFLYHLAQEHGTTDLWLGATDEQNEGNWVALDGRPAFTNWRPGQPNNKGDGEHYALMMVVFKGAPADGLWSDQPNEAQELHQPHFVCEWK